VAPTTAGQQHPCTGGVICYHLVQWAGVFRAPGSCFTQHGRAVLGRPSPHACSCRPRSSSTRSCKAGRHYVKTLSASATACIISAVQPFSGAAVALGVLGRCGGASGAGAPRVTHPVSSRPAPASRSLKTVCLPSRVTHEHMRGIEEAIDVAWPRDAAVLRPDCSHQRGGGCHRTVHHRRHANKRVHTRKQQAFKPSRSPGRAGSSQPTAQPPAAPPSGT
jgi:hypothetical protein